MPRPAVLLAAALLLSAAPPAAPAASWSWPLRGEVRGRFHVSPAAPFAAGQRRGIDIVAPPGATVRAACAGVVRFAGAVPRSGLAATVACGRLRATYLRLGALRVRAGARVGAGAVLGRLGPSGLLRLGARRASSARGYLDPLTLLRAERPPRRAPPPARPPGAPLPPPRRVPRASAPAPAPPVLAPGDRGLPAAGWLALALVASGLPVGGLVRARRRRAAGAGERRVRAARL